MAGIVVSTRSKRPDPGRLSATTLAPRTRTASATTIRFMRTLLTTVEFDGTLPQIATLSSQICAVELVNQDSENKRQAAFTVADEFCIASARGDAEPDVGRQNRSRAGRHTAR